MPNIIKTTHCLAAMSIKDHLIKLTMWWQGAQKLRNDRPGGAAAPCPSVSFATVCNTHSNFCIIFVIVGNFDETITKSLLILFILQPKLREQKETNNSQWVKARKNEIEKAWSLMGVQRNSSRREGKHFVYHFQIADDQCSLQDNLPLNKHLFSEHDYFRAE